ncbi:hypothetical protein J7I44_10715 [Frateuria sp. MAH-13]|uniref:Uncharacterized protein n=1 Tax=Frateuria flava TaxID=2821489 RepID=A0ABS4DNX7_9GAMM|nr:hypothetical protein [Frateuria flava]MBP1474770.1 hypothetical protein [Frateuria flava]
MGQSPASSRAPSPSGVIPAHIPLDAHHIVHIDTSKPIPFDEHSFGSYCFDTYGCKVLYNGRYDSHDPEDVKQASSASLGAKYPDDMYASWIGIRNFPRPAHVTWRSKDGQPHEAEVDIAKIFADQTVRHRVPQADLPAILKAPVYPGIILEVNDRTINVYMRAFVTTNKLQIAGNPYSSFRDDLILVHSKTY